jgi:hypothetical protein
MTKDSVISRLSFLGRIDAEVSREVEFAASHFHELDESSIFEIGVEKLCRILQSKSLKIKSEDWLCGLICNLVSRDENFFTLFEYVGFEWISIEIARRFIDVACGLMDFLNSSIMIDVGRRFVLPVSPKSSDFRVLGGTECGLRRESPLDGIISHLTSKCGGNVHELGVVNVTASTIGGDSAKYVVDLENRSICVQKRYNDSKPWICYDFKNLRVTPTHYALLSCSGYGPNTYHPKSWYVEGSDDGTEWTVLHECSNNSDLNGGGLIGQYPVSEARKCRFVRLRQTQHHSPNTGVHYLTLSGFELHGTLHEP